MKLIADPEAEAIVASYLLASGDDREGADKLLAGLSEDDFTSHTPRCIYRAAQRVWADGVAITTSSVHASLRELGFDRPTHADLLRTTLEAAASRAAAEAASTRLVELRRWRVLVEAGESFRRSYDSGRVPIDQVVAQALVDFDALGDGKADVVNLGDAMQERVAELRQAEGKPVRRVLTGFEPVDKLTGGFGETDLIVLAAETGGGKTAFAGHVFASMAERGGNVLVASAEMHGWELGDRMLSRVSYVPLKAIRDNQLDRDQREALGTVATHDAWKRIHVLERHGALTVQRIAQVARALQRRVGLSLVVVDYLQLISAIVPSGERGRTREAEVAAVVRGLKNTAMDIGVPVLALSQFNREASKKGGEPELHHLRESGEIEQAANVVVFLWQHQDDHETVRRLVCKKHRSGEINRTCRLRWNAKLVAFDAEAGS